MNCIFSGNRSENGAGIYKGGGNGDTHITNCSFWENNASANGGGIYSMGFGTVTITNCSFSKNIAQTGGGAYSGTDGTINVSNSIFWGNIGYQIHNEQIGATSVTFSLIEGGYPGNNLDADPLFVDIDNNNLRLKANSSAINAGNNADNNTSYDLDVKPRKVGVIDMGAYEFHGEDCQVNGILYVNKNANGLNNGTSWLNAYKNLQDALTNKCPGTTEIWVAEGTYYPDEGPDSLIITASFLACKIIWRSMVVAGTEDQQPKKLG